MTAADLLSNQFASFWLEPQILPQGYNVVNSISPKMINRPGRHTSSSPTSSFSSWQALTRPELACDAAKTEGYAELTVSITKAIAEIYSHPNVASEEESDEQAEAPAAKDGAAPIPPFFPLLRAYLNDKAVYQSKVGVLSPPLEPSGSLDGLPAAPQKTPSSTAPGSPTGSLVITSVHEIEFGEEIQLSVHTPASLFTLQLFEKDFCADLALSEILLASATIPIHSLHVGQNLDLVISVHCTLPQYYSLQSLIGGEPEPGKPPLPKHEPVAVITRVYVSLALTMPSRGYMVTLREIVALSLPRGPWTPQAIVDIGVEDDELVAITGCDIFSVAQEEGTVSVLGLIEAFSALVFSLTEGFDDLGSEEVVVHLKNTKADIPQEERLRMSYVAIVEDALTLAEYLVVGPLARTSNFIYEITHFQRPVTAFLIVMALWIPFASPQRALIYSVIISWLFAFFVTEVGIPTKPSAEANNKFSTLIAKLQQIQGAEMLVRPIEQSMNPATVRRIRIIELWIKALKTRVLRDASKDEDEHFQALLVRFCQNPGRMAVIMLLCWSSKARLMASLLAALFGTLVFCRHIPAVAAMFSLIRGLKRYMLLRRARLLNTREKS